MPNLLIACIYFPFAIVTVIILIEVSLRNIRHRGNYLFMLLCLLVIGWYATDIAGILVENEEAAKLHWNLLLIFVGFIPPVLLLFVLDFYRVSLKRAARFLPYIFVIPSINSIMVFTSAYHTLIYTQLEIVSLSPIHEVVRVWGPWFWVHTVHSYILSVLIISVILIRHLRLPKFYRLPSTLMTIGIFFTLVGNIVTLLQLLPAAMDPTLIGTSLALIFFNFAIINNNKSKFIRYSIGQVFDYLDLYILVLDENERVVHANRTALDWFTSIGITLELSMIDEIIESLLGIGAIQQDMGNKKEMDFYFAADPFPLVLNMHMQQMTDTNGDNIGSVAIFTDVTENRLLIKRLEEKAGMDSLTGIPNRMAYEGASKRFDAAEHLPLSVIMCDVNGLKAVNDNFGHQYGDMMLQVVAEVLEDVCPKQGLVARIGGDEFVFLLPRVARDTASALMELIRMMLSSRKNLPFPMSIAMGVATKYFSDEKLPDIVDLADSLMYENKRCMKKSV